MAVVPDNTNDAPDVGHSAPELTEEMAEEWLAKMGLLSLVENGDEFAECQKQLKKMKGRGRVCKQYDIGDNIEVFTMTRVLDNVETHRRHNVDATIMLFGADGADARYVLQVKYGIPGIPDFLAITHASCCTVVVGCSVHECKDLKGLVFTMPIELADGVQFIVEISWTLSQDAYRRFLKVTGTWLANYKPAASAMKEKKALKLMHGPKTKCKDV